MSAGFSGHANYCAANASADAIAGAESAKGLPHAAVQWGAWSSVGESQNVLVRIYHPLHNHQVEDFKISASSIITSSPYCLLHTAVGLKGRLEKYDGLSERVAITGMVADKHKVDPKKAEALGMLLPKTGLTALASVLKEAASGASVNSVRGAAGLVYWQKLLANVKPTPPMFADIMAVPQTVSARPAKVRRCFFLLYNQALLSTKRPHCMHW